MNNFDDLFEQQPQAEAAPQKQESQKERPKRQWWQIREEKQRKEAYATLDRILESSPRVRAVWRHIWMCRAVFPSTLLAMHF